MERTGRTLVITDRGKPVLELRPYGRAPEDLLEAFRGCVRRYEDPLEPVGVDHWEALG